MQKDLDVLKKSGVQLVAISFDDAKVLTEFGKEQKIGFALLSDPGSKTIEAYGIRNVEAKDSRIDGVPYPGTFLIDREGIVRAKLFYDGYKERHHAKDIVSAAENLPKAKKKAA